MLRGERQLVSRSRCFASAKSSKSSWLCAPALRTQRAHTPNESARDFGVSMSDSARKFMACCVAWRVRGARARAWLVGGRWHSGGRERTGGCVERVTPQHPVRRRCASLKPVHQVPTAHAAKALAVAAVEDDRVARLHGQTQWRWRLWRRLARAPEALAGRPVHWRGAVKSVESRPDPQGARYAVEAQQQGGG